MRPLLVGASLLALALACGGPSREPQADPGPTAGPKPAKPALKPVKTFPPLDAAQAEPLELDLVGTDEEYPIQAERYPSLLATDGQLDTTWVVRGVSHFEIADAQIVALELVPGYAKSDATWKNNRRPTKIRWRPILPADEVGKRGTYTLGAWTEVTLSPPEELTASPFVRIPISDGTSALRGIELEVLDATAKTRSEDICISELRLLGKRATPKEKEMRSEWRFITSDYMARPDLRRLEAPFDEIDLEKCSYYHNGTGGGGLSFEGKCSREGAGWRFTGKNMEMTGFGPAELVGEVDRVLSFTPIGECTALIDGWPFSRC